MYKNAALLQNILKIRSRLGRSHEKPLHFSLKRQKFSRFRNFCMRRTIPKYHFFKCCQKLKTFLAFPKLLHKVVWSFFYFCPTQHPSRIEARYWPAAYPQYNRISSETSTGTLHRPLVRYSYATQNFWGDYYESLECGDVAGTADYYSRPPIAYL